MTRRLNFLLLSLIIIGVPYYWFLMDAGASAGEGTPRAKPVTITRLRKLAEAIPGPRPVAVRVETVGRKSVSLNVMVAGAGLHWAPASIRAYQLVVPGTGAIVLDAGTSRETARRHDLMSYDPLAQARVEQALGKAGHKVLLVDKSLHNGGHPHGGSRSGWFTAPSGGAPAPVAPGVVAIPVTGLTPGSTMIYARLADGREFLFTGEAAKANASWRELRPPARWATRHEPSGYRREAISWLMTINALHAAAPQMVIVTSHDSAQVPFTVATFSD